MLEELRDWRYYVGRLEDTRWKSVAVEEKGKTIYCIARNTVLTMSFKNVLYMIQVYIVSAVNNLFRKAAEISRAETPVKHGNGSTIITNITSPYFWPNISNEDSEHILREREDGTFLVRKSSLDGTQLEICYRRHGSIANMKIDFDGENYSLDTSNELLPKEKSLDSLMLTIMERCKDHSLMVVGDTREKCGLVKLRYPVKRSVTLMDHCKRKLLLDWPKAKFEQCDLPKDVKNFLSA